MISNSFKQNQIHIFQEYSSGLFLEFKLVIENYADQGKRTRGSKREERRGRERRRVVQKCNVNRKLCKHLFVHISRNTIRQLLKCQKEDIDITESKQDIMKYVNKKKLVSLQRRTRVFDFFSFREVAIEITGQIHI